MDLNFSIIIPVYNRPQEINNLLETISNQDFKNYFEVIIIEDGSSIRCKEFVNNYSNLLNIKYFFKDNSGAGLSRNFGMKRALGNYFIILDSDVLLPKNYLSIISNTLKLNFTDAFGGPDRAAKNFTNLQKAINYSMTSFFTTGGIRGNKKSFGKFQPRSFNFGISKRAFQVTKGFLNMKTGEDIDLTFRLWRNNFKTQLIEKAYVYHKRRTTINKFFKQAFSFGMARPILNKKYPKTSKIIYWLPSFFSIGIILSFILNVFFGIFILPVIYLLYFIFIFIESFALNKSFKVAFLSIVTTFIQFVGYGLGFLKSTIFKNFY